MGDTTTVPDSAGEFAGTADSVAGLDEVLWNTISTAVLLRSHPRFDERVLDAYARDGASALPTAELVGIGGLVDAVEPSESLVSLARERAGERMPQLQLHVADPAGWEPTGYDLVQCVLGVAAFDDVEAGTRHLVERARPGGRVVIAAWARDALDPLPGLLAAAVRDRDDDAEASPAALTVDVADSAGNLAHWLTELGLLGVRAEEVQRHVDLTPELAWQLVEGTRLRSALAGLDDERIAAVRERYLASVAGDDVVVVDLSTLIAVGRRPEA
ncbi:class I SAM-dependent methyltransferase [Agromyces mariniharenae]|uniref:SAM-dependent methyltransferase n=1 Tax=Agromyces mariniharenae TaxID=2604423 RepID=A0A5S4V4L5_9MICO|nr:SAM-dependent methyltransferase [Agromyces mariniharenae]TYL53946.1 SAM-dependent methyltransferase [Agromyces mariniharenae]